MANGNGNRDQVTKWIRWIARIWSLPILVFALIWLFGYAWNWATGGGADPHAVADYPPIENLPPIFIFLSILGLGLAWRWERLGGQIAIDFQLAMLVVLLIHYPLAQDFSRSAIPYLLLMIITVPGILFLTCWWRSR